MKKIKWSNIIRLVLCLLFLTLFTISAVKIILWKIDSNNTNKMINKLNDINVKNVKDNDNTIVISQDNIDENSPYWYYIKMNLINVNFNDLKTINSDTKGWIQVLGTNINYPFVQASDNDFYLNHSFDKSNNDAGWLFLDYRNNVENFDTNTIIYGHSRLDKTMFGTLKNVFTNGWLDDINNHVIRLSTEYENTLWQVFSVYKIPTTNDYLYNNFNNNKDYINFINLIKGRSSYDFNTSVNENDKILTLSTCYGNSDKVVMHAKLIKKE